MLTFTKKNILKTNEQLTLIVFDCRVRSCEAASELLAKYRRGHEVEQMVTNTFKEELRVEKIEDLGPSEAELEAERLRVRLNITC